jgi:nucleoside-diphosphate-sugar epimerase
MDIFLTGGSGYIGGAVLSALVARGDSVRAIARSDDSATKVEAAGATAVRGEITDAELLRAEAERADAVIHTASPGDATSPDADRIAADAFQAAKLYVHTGGVWSLGNTHGGADETHPLAPPAMTAWRTEVEEDVLARGGIIVMPGVVYGEGQGLLPMVFGDGRYVGDGTYHVAVVHVDDTAACYLRALEAEPGTRLVAVAQTVSARDLATAFAGGDARSETLAEAEARLSAPLAGAMTLDQRITAVHTRALGWSPEHRDVVTEVSPAA